MTKDQLKQVYDALETGLEAAREVAEDYHGKMKGYRQHEHDRLDSEVLQVEAALLLVKTVMTQPVTDDPVACIHPDTLALLMADPTIDKVPVHRVNKMQFSPQLIALYVKPQDKKNAEPN